VAEWGPRSYFEDDGVTEYILETGNAHSGNHFVTLRNNMPNDGRVFQFVNVKPLTVYKLSGWIKCENLQGNEGAAITVFDSFATTTPLKTTGGVWQYVEFYGMTGPYQARMPIGFRLGGWTSRVTGSASFDDISLVQEKNRTGANIQSMSFIDPYSDEKANTYFSREQDQRFSGSALLMSLYLAILLFIAAICFTVYNVFIKGSMKKIESICTTAFKSYFYIFIAVLFVIFFIVFCTNPSSITMLDVQVFFIISVIAACAIAAYLYKTGQLTLKNLTKLVLALGIALRLSYFLYADMYTRQHDLWGGWSHQAYIEWVATHFSLPPVGVYEAYHPPVHYILSAIVFDIVKLFKSDNIMAFRGVELLMTFLSAIFLIFVYKIFNIIKANEKVMLIGVGFACFLPNLIYMSTYLNNDPMVMLFYTVSFYLLLKWIDEKTIKNTILFALFTAIAVLSKKFSLIMYPLAGIVFVVELIRNKSELKKYLIQGAIFIAIAVPLGLSYQIRNYILFGQDLSYAVPAFGNIMSGNPYNLFYIDVGKLLSQPLSSQAPDQRQFFLMEMIRTALFEVFEFSPSVNDIAVVVMFFYLTNLLVFVIFFVLFRKEDFGNKTYVFLINMVGVILLYLSMRNTGPYDCTYAFRYVSPYIYISLAYFFGHAITRFGKTRYPVLNVIVHGQFWLWCASVAVFTLMLGF
jgi:hypothetical protein